MWIFIGIPLLVLGQGLQIYLVNINRTHAANEASFVTAKALAGIGRGFYQTAAQVTVQAVVLRSDVGIVTAVFYASMNLGGAIGTRYVALLLLTASSRSDMCDSVAGAIWRNTLPKKLATYLPDSSKKLAMPIFKSIVVAQKYPAGSEERYAIDRSYRESQKILAIAATASLAIMLFVMWFIKSVDLRKEQHDEEHVESETAQGVNVASKGVGS
jgi:hypothetical protein